MSTVSHLKRTTGEAKVERKHPALIYYHHLVDHFVILPETLCQFIDGEDIVHF